MQLSRQLIFVGLGFFVSASLANPALRKLLSEIPNGNTVLDRALTADEVFVNVHKTCLVLRHNNKIELFEGPRSRLQSFDDTDFVAQAFGQSTYEKSQIRLSVSARSAYARLLGPQGKVERSICQAKRY